MKPIAQNGRLAGASPENPQEVKGVLYTESTDTDGMTVYTATATTGMLVGKAPAGSAGAGLVLADGLVYTAQSSFGNASLLALNALSGQQVWKTAFPWLRSRGDR
jgi:outer membrane protein assembly factor BamB